MIRCLLIVLVLLVAVPSAAVASAPTAKTDKADRVTFQNARLTGTVDPNAEDTTYWFEYGTTTAYGAKTADTVVSGDGNKAVNATVSGLAATTTYHFRLVARNASGTVTGTDKSFNTRKSPYAVPPQQNAVSAALAPPVITWGGTSVISGQVTGPKSAGARIQLQQLAYPFAGRFTNVGPRVAADAAGKFALNIAPTLLTRYQVVAHAASTVTSSAVQESVRWLVAFSVNHTRVRRGHAVRFSGTVAPVHNGGIASIQRRTSTGKWKTVARTTLRQSTTKPDHSSYSRSLRIRRKGTYRVRVAADAAHATNTSRTRTIRIR